MDSLKKPSSLSSTLSNSARENRLSERGSRLSWELANGQEGSRLRLERPTDEGAIKRCKKAKPSPTSSNWGGKRTKGAYEPGRWLHEDAAAVSDLMASRTKERHNGQ